MRKIECFKEWLQWFKNQQPKREVKKPVETFNQGVMRYFKKGEIL